MEDMNLEPILIAFLSLLIAEFVFSAVLEFLNLQNLRVAENDGVQNEKKDDGLIPQQIDAQALAYSKDRTHFAIFSLLVNFLLILFFVVLKIPGKIENLFITSVSNPYTTGMGTIFATAFIFSIPALFLSAYFHFVIEERHGFNRMTLKIFFQDMLKSMLLSVLLGLPVFAAVLCLVNTLGSSWWIYSFFLVAALQLLIAFFFPVLIAPLFFRFSPLEDGPLKERLQELAKKSGFTFKAIQIMDGSRRSSHSNAFFSGFGSSKRIALFDTLLETLTEDEIEAVVAHELGHAKMGHTIKQLLSSLFFLFSTFFILGYLLKFNGLFRAFGFNSPSVYALMVLALFFSSPVTFWFTPISSFVSRRREYAADAFAQDYCGDYRPLAEGLIKLHQSNKSNPVPHRLYSFFHYSHPTVPERISAMQTHSLEKRKAIDP